MISEDSREQVNDTQINENEESQLVEWIYIDLFKDSNNYESPLNKSNWVSDTPFKNELAVHKIKTNWSATRESSADQNTSDMHLRSKKLKANKSFTINNDSFWLNKDSLSKVKSNKRNEKSSVFMTDKLDKKYKKIKQLIGSLQVGSTSKATHKKKEIKSLKKNVKKFLKDQETRNIYQFARFTK